MICVLKWYSQVASSTYIVSLTTDPQPPTRGQISEDCLTVNILRPVANRQPGQSPLPVMVWIYGGGFQRK